LALIYTYTDLDEGERQAAFSLLPGIEIALDEEGIEEDDIEEMAVKLACSFIRNEESGYGEIYAKIYKDIVGEIPENNPYDFDDEDDDIDD